MTDPTDDKIEAMARENRIRAEATTIALGIAAEYVRGAKALSLAKWIADEIAAAALAGIKAGREMGEGERATALKLVAKLEGYAFECEAGPLTNCADWTDLKKLLEASYGH